MIFCLGNNVGLTVCRIQNRLAIDIEPCDAGPAEPVCPRPRHCADIKHQLAMDSQ